MVAESLTERLGRFIAETPGASIPEVVRERARISLVHNLCMAIGGRGRHPVADIYARRFHATPQEATLLSDGSRVALEAAAFANGALFHARSQDDTHPASTSHPGAPVMAAALAVAETEGASGREFLDAVILGYETLCRIGRDFDEAVTGRGFRAAAVYGGFGAAAAAARLMGLSAGATGHALGFVAHQAGGLAQVWIEGSEEYPMQLGLGARAGVQAARLASVGMTAARELLEGPKGFYGAYAGTAEAPVEAVDGLSHVWQFEEVTVKSFPTCAILQGPLGLLKKMLSGAGDAEVSRIVLSLNPYEADFSGVDNPGPEFASPTAAKMSAQFCLGMMALDRRLRLDDLSRLKEPALAGIARHIEVRRDLGIAPRLCALEVRLVDGRRLAGRVKAPAGRPDFNGIAAFALRTAPEMGMSKLEVRRLVDRVRCIDELPDLGELLEACFNSKN